MSYKNWWQYIPDVHLRSLTCKSVTWLIYNYQGTFVYLQSTLYKSIVCYCLVNTSHNSINHESWSSYNVVCIWFQYDSSFLKDFWNIFSISVYGPVQNVHLANDGQLGFQIGTKEALWRDTTLSNRWTEKHFWQAWWLGMQYSSGEEIINVSANQRYSCHLGFGIVEKVTAVLLDQMEEQFCSC